MNKLFAIATTAAISAAEMSIPEDLTFLMEHASETMQQAIAADDNLVEVMIL